MWQKQRFHKFISLMSILQVFRISCKIINGIFFQGGKKPEKCKMQRKGDRILFSVTVRINLRYWQTVLYSPAHTINYYQGLFHHTQSQRPVPFPSPPAPSCYPVRSGIDQMCFSDLWEWPGYLILATVAEVIRGRRGEHHGNFRKGHLANEEH